jgi:hypothetical protein
MNVEHWQSKSDQQTILHIARVPLLFGRKLEGAEITVGASSAIVADDPDADLRYVEHSGKAIESGRISLKDLEDNMRQVGAELLVIKPGNTTVVQTQADNEAGMCVLQRIAQDLEDALDQSLQLLAEWVNQPEGGHVTVFKDFGVASLEAASLELLRDMNVDGTLSDETLYREGQRRGVIGPDVSWEDEKIRIKANTPKANLGKVSITD